MYWNTSQTYGSIQRNRRNYGIKLKKLTLWKEIYYSFKIKWLRYSGSSSLIFIKILVNMEKVKNYYIDMF